MNGLKRARLEGILESFKGLRAMVIGDFALDVYWYADMTHSELSRETPHHTRPVVRETYSPGASGNICCNVKALGVNDVFAVTVIGEDWRGQILKGRLEENGIVTDRIVESSERVTSTYIKPILCGWESQQEDSRLDFVNRKPLSEANEAKLIESIQVAASEVDAVIVEDQMTQNGVVTDRVRESLIRLAERNLGKTFVADSRERIGLFRSMVLKPNKMEAVKAVDPSKDPSSVKPDELLDIAQRLLRCAGRPVYVTLSKEGVLVVTDSENVHLPAAPAKPPIDPVGAGDTFISSIAMGLAAGASPVEAGIVANLAAGVILKKLNITGTASPEEVLVKFDEIAENDEWP